jgi:hypothetical protein
MISFMNNRSLHLHAVDNCPRSGQGRTNTQDMPDTKPYLSPNTHKFANHWVGGGPFGSCDLKYYLVGHLGKKWGSDTR